MRGCIGTQEVVDGLERMGSVCFDPGYAGRPYLRAGVQREGTGQPFLVQGTSFVKRLVRV